MTESKSVETTAEMPWYRQVGKSGWRAFIATYLGGTLDSMDTMLYSICILAIMKEFNLNLAQAGMLAGATLMFAGVGAWLFGILADKIGRRLSLIICILTYALATGATGLAQTVIQLSILRVIVGIGLGGEWPLGDTLISETWPAKYRARVVSFVRSAFATGFLLGALLGAWFLPLYGWRVLFFIGALPALLTLWIRTGVKETVFFKEMKGRHAEGTEKIQGSFAKFSELWSKRYLKTTIGLMLFSICAFFAWYAVMAWLPGYLGTPVEKGGAGLSIVKSSLFVAEMQFGAILGYICFGFFADSFGRKKVVIIDLLLFAVMIPIYFSVRNPALILILGPILAFFASGWVPALGVFGAEFYPTRIRGTGTGFFAGCGRFTSAFGPYAIGVLAMQYGLGKAFLIVPLVLVIGILGIGVLRETKGTQLDAVK